MDVRAKRISEAIEASGLSYAELSKLTDISKSSLQRYATGETKKIPIDSIEAIAKATNSEARYLMGWEDPEEKSAPTDDGRGEKIEEIIKKIAQLSDSDLIQLDNFVSFLVAQSKTNTKE